MKRNIMKCAVKEIPVFLCLMLVSVLTFAQEKGLDIDIDVNKENDQWYNNPWAWVIGGAVFILLLVAIVRGGGKTSD